MKRLIETISHCYLISHCLIGDYLIAANLLVITIAIIQIEKVSLSTEEARRTLYFHLRSTLRLTGTSKPPNRKGELISENVSADCSFAALCSRKVR